MNKFLAFSIAEALVTLTIVGIAAGSAAPLISKTMKNSQISNYQIMDINKTIDKTNNQIKNINNKNANQDKEIETLKTLLYEKIKEIDAIKETLTNKGTDIENLSNDISNLQDKVIQKGTVVFFDINTYSSLGGCPQGWTNAKGIGTTSDIYTGNSNTATVPTNKIEVRPTSLSVIACRKD